MEIEETPENKESNEEPMEAESQVEEDGPIEDWTKKELVEECKTLGISDKGNKAVLVARIKEAWAAKKSEEKENKAEAEAPAPSSETESPAEEEPVAEAQPEAEAEAQTVESVESEDQTETPEATETVVEEQAVEETSKDSVPLADAEEENNSAAADDAASPVEESTPADEVQEEAVPSEAAQEEVTPVVEAKEVVEEEDGPIESWSKKELIDECKSLGISDKGNKAVLIERIKESWAAKKTEEKVAEPEAVDEPMETDETEPEATESIETEPTDAAKPEAVESENTPPEADVTEPVSADSEPEPTEAVANEDVAVVAEETTPKENEEARDFELTPTSITDLIMRNDNNQ